MAEFLVVAIVAGWILYKLFGGSSSSKPAARGEPREHGGASYDGRVSVSQRNEQGGSDAWEGSFWEVTRPLSVAARIRIKYTDGKQRRSERTVDVRQFGAVENGALLIGHCHLRDATRTFRSDRIQSCVDMETGEVISDVRAFLQRKYDESPNRTRDLLLEAEYDVLRVLLYVGKADGQLRAAEKSVIKDACIAISKDSRLTEGTIDELFSAMDVPSLQAFRLAVGRLSKRDDAAKVALMDAAKRIVGTQKTVHESERVALDYIQTRFFGNLGDADASVKAG